MPRALLALLLVACSDSCPDPYIIEDEVEVWFRAGTTAITIDAINAEIGAGVLSTDDLGSALVSRMELPNDIPVDDARAFYMTKPEVTQATWVVSHECPAQ